jgi:hypothetical protein
MSFLYPRRVTLARPSGDDTPGEQAYGGDSTPPPDVIAQNLKAHIEAERQGSAPDARLPDDAAGQSIWLIIFPKMALGYARSRDVITDEIGNRYQVISADWGPLVTTCRSMILET